MRGKQSQQPNGAELPGFWLTAAWLWSDPLPSVEEVALRVGGQAYADYLIEQLRRQGYPRKP